MLESDPENERIKAMLINFDQALSHPDHHDLEELRAAVQKAVGA